MAIDKYTEDHTIRVIDGKLIIDAVEVEFGSALSLSNGLSISSGDITVLSGDVSANNISGAIEVSAPTGTFTGLVSNTVSTGTVIVSGSVNAGTNITATDITASGSIVSDFLTVSESAIIKDLEVTGTLTADLVGSASPPASDDGSRWEFDVEGLKRYDNLGDLQGGVIIDENDLFGIQIDPDIYIRMDDDLLEFGLGAGGLRWDWPSASGPIIMDFGNILRLDLDNLLLNPIDPDMNFTVGGIDLRHSGGMYDIGNMSIKDTDTLSLIDGALNFDTGYGSINGVEWGLEGNQLRMGDLRFDVSTKNLSLNSGALLFEGFNLANMDSLMQGNVANIALNTNSLLDVAALTFDNVTKNLDVVGMETLNNIPFMESGGVEMLGSLRFGVGNDLYLDAGNLKMNGLELYASGGVEHIGSYGEFSSTIRTTAGGGFESANLNIATNGAVSFGNGFDLDAGGNFNLSQSLSIGGLTFAAGTGAITGALGNMLIDEYGGVSGSIGQMNIATGGAITGQLGDLNIASTGVVAVGSTTFDLVTSTWSDRRLKKNIKTIKSGLESVLSINPVSFEWIDNKGRPDRVCYGVIAQEVAEVIPELVMNLNEIIPDLEADKLAVDYNGILPFLISAIQEQQILINDLRKEVDHLKLKEI